MFTTLATAYSITFINRDEKQRTICWFPAAGFPAILGTVVPGHSSKHVSMPGAWNGSWRTIFDGGNPSESSIRGEVTFNGFVGDTYYDVEAIDNCCDNSGVKWLYPASGNGVHSGCNTFPCDGAYKKWDDIQTQSTSEKDLVCEIGG
ncbi:hypothetical protein LSUE1_G004755 [Lachnellula suecica]|uniref:Uncharacterized protein n=1 Tax=Lachnellula suecica TaxID=602035 RepID=A0A8T9CGN0_9HELO|nr:hypothetical protein LSUE1_G004755 [Lachnellula suecica]